MFIWSGYCLVGLTYGRTTIRDGKCPSVFYPSGNCLSGICPRGSVHRAIVQSGYCPRTIMSVGLLSVGELLSGICPPGGLLSSRATVLEPFLPPVCQRFSLHPHQPRPHGHMSLLKKMRRFLQERHIAVGTRLPPEYQIFPRYHLANDGNFPFLHGQRKIR